MMTKLFLLFAAVLTLAACIPRGASAAGRDLFSDTWVATDALGRRLPTASAARAARGDRFVGIFYFLWQGEHGTSGPYDNTRLLAADPENPAFGPVGAFHWWGEPAVGYFRADDPWVVQRNIAMLQTAGVDVLLCDVTNAFTYPKEVQVLCEVMRKMRREGNRTPQIAFVTHAFSADTVAKLYNEFYSKNLYPEFWFHWQGKPLILGPENEKRRDGTPLPSPIHDFFTWRDSWAWEPGQHKWQWIDRYPQRYGWDRDPKVAEEAPVAVASHPTSNIGRSFHNGKQPPIDRQAMAADTNQGLHFAEQWRRLLEIDPQFAFIDGWNEWVAQRFTTAKGQRIDLLGKTLPEGGSFFVDAYTEEFSRDIMPMKGGYGDNYYFQMVEGIRRFKGVRPLPKASGAATISLGGSFAQWRMVAPEYRDAIGDTTRRDWPGWGTLHYKDASGRNDITTAKVACDQNNIYFLVQTKDKVTSYRDPNWMLLLIDADQNPKTGWGGYDFVVNQRVLNSTTTTITRLRDGKTTRVRYRVSGNQMMIAVPRAQLGLDRNRKIAFDFHWVDNCPIGGDINAFWYTGDSAPDGRFNYRYENARVR